MKAWGVAGVLAIVLSVSWTIPASSQPLARYDGFGSGVIDPALWLGYLEPDRWDEINGESARRVVGGQAQIALTSYLNEAYAAYQPLDTGPRGRNGLRINRAALADHSPIVTRLRATVTIAAVSVPDDLPGYDCGPFRSGRASAQLFGHFFKDGRFAWDNRLADDVFAILSLEQRVIRSDAGSAGLQNVMEISIFRCRDAFCQTIDPFGDPYLLPRQWSAGIPYVLEITWRPASRTFAFTVAGGGFSDTHLVEYVTTSTRKPRAYAYDLRVETAPGVCTSGDEVLARPVSIDARFDNVYVNADAAP